MLKVTSTIETKIFHRDWKETQRKEYTSNENLISQEFSPAFSDISVTESTRKAYAQIPQRKKTHFCYTLKLI